MGAITRKRMGEARLIPGIREHLVTSESNSVPLE